METTTRFIPWRACTDCGKPIHGEAIVEMNGIVVRHKPRCPDLIEEDKRSAEDAAAMADPREPPK